MDAITSKCRHIRSKILVNFLLKSHILHLEGILIVLKAPWSFLHVSSEND